MAGRPRLTGPREPNGRLSRAGRGQNLQRELDMLRTGACDAKWGTPIGTLCRAGQITARMFDDAMWFAEARDAADRALGLRGRHPTAQDMNAVHGASNAQDDEAQIRAKRRAIETYDRACAFIGLGSAELAAMELVVVYQRRPDKHEQLLALISALEKLRAYRTVRRAA